MDRIDGGNARPERQERRERPTAREAGGRATRGLAGFVVLGALLLRALVGGDAAQAAASNDESLVLVLVNALRADPAAFGVVAPVAPPLAWSETLAGAARSHSADMSGHPGCFQHDSCDGTPWDVRLRLAYPRGTWIAEVIALRYGSPEAAVDGWIDSPPHLEILLSSDYAELGAGIAAPGGPYYTADLGTPFPGIAIPSLAAGGVTPRIGAASVPRRVLASVHAPDGRPPRHVFAHLGAACVELPLAFGEAASGVYQGAVTPATPPTGGSCEPLRFEVSFDDGSTAVFPGSGESLLVGVDRSCGERASGVQSSVCGPGVAPTPRPSASPSPTATPAASATASPVPTSAAGSLSAAQVVLHPGAPGRARVLLQAELMPPSPGFDPAGSGGVLRLKRGSSTVWSRTLPASCRGVACLKALPSGQSWRARYASSGPGLTLRRNRNGTLLLRFWAVSDPVGPLLGGAVRLEVQLGAAAASAALEMSTHAGRWIAR